jgi:hypothetical protein
MDGHRTKFVSSLSHPLNESARKPQDSRCHQQYDSPFTEASEAGESQQASRQEYGAE